MFRVSVRKLFKGGGGEQLEESGFIGGVMIVKYVTKFYTYNLGGVVCLDVCVCSVAYMVLD